MVKSRAVELETMEFGECEVDDSIWEKEAEEGEVKDSLSERLACEARAEVHAAPLLSQEGQEVPGMVEGSGKGSRALTEQDILLLVDAANGFNNISRLEMLWSVRHQCPCLSRFAINCYRHEVCLLCRHPGQIALILLSKEGITQGDPLLMSLYGIALLPLYKTEIL